MTTDCDDVILKFRGNGNPENNPEDNPSPRMRTKAQSRKKSGKNLNFPPNELPRNIKNAEGKNTDSFYYVDMENANQLLDVTTENQDLNTYNPPDIVDSTQQSQPETRRLIPDLSWEKGFPDPKTEDVVRYFPNKSEGVRKSPKTNDAFRKSPKGRRSPKKARSSSKTDRNRPLADPGGSDSPKPLVFNEQIARVTPKEKPLLLTPDSPDDTRSSTAHSRTSDTTNIGSTRPSRSRTSAQSARGVHRSPRLKTRRPTLPKRISDELESANRPDIENAFDLMREGESLLMVEHSRWVSRTVNTECRLAPDMLHVNYVRRRCWMPNMRCGRIKSSFNIRDVMMARSGRDGLLRVIETDLPEDQCFSIVFDTGSKKTMNFLASTSESAKYWVKGINFIKKSVETLLPRLQRELYLWEIFTKSDKNADGYITWMEVLTMFQNMGASASFQSKTDIKEKFQKHASDHNPSLNFEQFMDFHQEATMRPEIAIVFHRYSPDNEFLTARELYKFLQDSQREYDITEADCLKIINDYEMKEYHRARKEMSVHSFATFMQSPTCDVFNQRHDEIYQDMKHPLSHYFIASSHNTYLTGDQLKDPSSTDAYMKVLLQGCRCVELDCWDGPDDEPVIYHGYTLTSKIKFKDTIEVIGRYAFEASRFPLILSIENHCSVPQQEKMAAYMQRILGTELLTECVIAEKDESHLPSPVALQGKILIKGKKLPPVTSHDDEVEDDSSADEAGDVSDEDEAAEMERVIHGRIDDRRTSQPRGMGLFNRRSMTSPNDAAKCDESMKQLLGPSCIDASSRISAATPSVSNQSSTRTREQEKKLKLSKRLSDQVVYNKSTKFKGIEQGKRSTTFREISSFSENKAHRLASQQTQGAVAFHCEHLNRTYPGATRTDSSNYDPQPLWNAGFQVVALNYQTKCDEMTLYNAKFRQNGGCGYILKPAFMRSSNDDVINEPEQNKSLRVTVISGSYLPVQLDGSNNLLSVGISISGNEKDVGSKRTKSTRSNGYNPVWEEDISFNLQVPSMAMVWFKVSYDDSETIGQFVLPFSSISEGYRTVHLMDCCGTPLRSSCLLVHISVNDITTE